VIRALFLVSAGLVLLVGLPPMPTLPVWTRPDPVVTVPAVPGPATTATYVYEKDAGAIPVWVTTGLNRLNRERKIVATTFEADATTGAGKVPESIRPGVEAAKKGTLPALVVLSGSTVLRVVPAPATEAEVVEAVP
jgi:hypothetical protein